jgi:LysR family cys regulon transcriptional activator
LNFQQLRIVRETVRRSFNLTEVSSVLFTSQSGVSKHIKALEEELGVEIFVRRGKRLIGLTEPGREVAAIVERMLGDAKSIRALADEFVARDVGRLTVATTHTQARYALPKVVAAFKTEFPKVHLVLHETSAREIVSMLRDGQADIGIATEALAEVEDFAVFPYYTWRHTVVVPKGHPLVGRAKLTLADVAEYPIVTYRDGFTGRASVDRAFDNAGLVPNVVVSALDADVIKTYVESGLGVGIVASMACVEGRDPGLCVLDSESFFEMNTTVIAVHRGQFLRGFAYRFIELCSPEVNEARVREQLD